MATNIWSIARKRNATFRFCIKIKIKIRTDRKIQKKLASEYSKTKIIHLLITILNDIQITLFEINKMKHNHVESTNFCD